MEESIHIKGGEQSLCDKEAKEMTFDEWEQVELDKDNGSLVETSTKLSKPSNE